MIRQRELLAARASEATRLVAKPNAVSIAQVARIQRRVAESVEALDAAVTHAAGIVDPLAYRLRRTWHREGRDYLVPYVNHLGADVIASFDTAKEATRFRNTIRLIEDAKREGLHEPPWDPKSMIGPSG